MNVTIANPVKVSEVEVIKSIVSIGDEDGAAGVHIASLPCPKVNDAGVSSAWNWKVAAATAVATLNTVAAYKIANMQYEDAKEHWRLARERWDYFKNTYLPCEKKEIAEACTAPIPKADYNKAVNKYTAGVNQAYNRADGEVGRLSALYCVCQDESLLRDIELSRSQFIGDGVNYAIRREEAVAEAMDDVRWNRKIGVLNRGRGLLSTSASYATAATNMYDQFGKSISAVAEGATSFIGYALNRTPTVYPNRSGMGGGFFGYATPSAPVAPIAVPPPESQIGANSLLGLNYNPQPIDGTMYFQEGIA